MNTPDHTERRNKLKQIIGYSGVAIVYANSLIIRNNDNHYHFRQDSNFDYLTGFPEADAIAVFTPGHAEGEYWLFCQPKNPELERWEGAIIGPDAAMAQYGADCALPLSEFPDRLSSLLENRLWVYADFHQNPERLQRLQTTIKQLENKQRRGIEAPQGICFLDPVLAQLRLYKSASERALMQRAADIAVGGHLAAARIAKHSDHEYQIQAALEGHFYQQGIQHLAFGSIVASGENACTLHYRDNQAPVDKQALLLIDAGAEYQGYASDITTTIPASGTFSSEQKAVYDVVLHAQQQVIQALNIGGNWHELHQLTCRLITQGLVDLDILSGDVDGLIEQEAYKPWFMHGTGHWLGRDVHDVGRYRTLGEWTRFKANMALTIEPGLYFSPSDQVHERWHGIGIRIEDSILLTEDSIINLTEALPRTTEAIEQFMNEG